MTLKNNKGSIRNFNILFRLEKADRIYLIYKDVITGKIYSSKMQDDKLIPLEDKEFSLVNNMLERIRG